jgi:ABC-type transport system involved in cytochrome bd biosynthesis fused ATPase/permease subunit
MYSLSLGLQDIDAPTWVLEGDVFFDRQILLLSGSPHISWFVDSASRHLDGAYVESNASGRALSLQIIRDLRLLESGQAKSVGILKLTQEGTRHQAPVMILDEPTSFMDSWAEVDWFDRFRELATGRTVILITHRFTIARKADIIHVMEDGQIVETGTHEELLAANGRYAESWLAQTNPTDNAQATHLNGKSNVHPVTRA